MKKKQEQSFATQMPIEFEDPGLEETIEALERMQSEQASIQQPSKKLDNLIKEILADRPEWRQRMAVMTKSPLLRQKILTLKNPGGRAVGSGVLLILL